MKKKETITIHDLTQVRLEDNSGPKSRIVTVSQAGRNKRYAVKHAAHTSSKVFISKAKSEEVNIQGSLSSVLKITSAAVKIGPIASMVISIHGAVPLDG